MTASEDNLSSLRNSAERVVASVAMIGGKVLSDPRVSGPSEKVSRELRQAKAVGQFTVLSATAKLKSTLCAAKVEPTDEAPELSPASSPPPAPACIPNYVDLSASQLVSLIRALNDDERAEVLAYEQATRQRKTILAALRKQPA